MLNTELAQKIVDSIMPIISRNINIMDEKGIIIGSGNKDRLGKFHKIAFNIIQNPQDEELFGKIDQVDESNDMLPGINLPIFFRNTVIGAVGITGNPEEVMTYGKLIQITVELLVWKEYNSSSQDVRRMLMTEFVTTLLDKKTFSNNFLNEVNSAKIPYEKLAYCMIAKHEEKNLKETISIMDEAIKFFPSCIIGRYNENIVLFMEKEPTSRMIDILREKDIHLYMGCKVDHWLQLHKSYFIARALILFNRKINNFSSYEDSKLEISIITNYLDYPYLYDQDLEKFKKIRLSDSLLSTYVGFLKYHGVIKDICTNLYIHRNTVIYRLEKIREMTGFNIHCLEDAYRLYSLFVISEINEQEHKDLSR